MTATLPAPRRFRLVVSETRVFAAATTVLLFHALDDAFVHRQPGVGLGQHALAALISVVVGVAAILAFGRLRPGLRAGVAFAFGGLAVVNGGLHVIHVADAGVAGSDLTGVLAAGAGLALIGLAVAIPWRRRGSGRWLGRAIAVPATLLGTLLVLIPTGVAIVDTHKFREDVGEPPSAEYRDVTFRSTDGLELAGWYKPSRNGSAVVVVHGGGSDRKGAVGHATMLAGHGYGVLLYDARGRGESEGSPNSYGWGWEKDAAGAVAFLKAQPDVRRIGGLGLSSGADTLVDVAASNPDLAATVADGAALRTLEDAQRVYGFDVGALIGWTNFKAIEVLNGSAPPAPLEERVARISSPLLLISAGRAAEYDFNVHYERVAQPTTQHWNLPDAHHTRGLREHRAEYERRVVAFFDRELR
jgi:dienelactone hydrolase